jgi:hypothetical protein
MDDKTKIFSVAFPSAKRYRLIGGSQNFLPLFFFSSFLSFFFFVLCVYSIYATRLKVFLLKQKKK